jgi:hypothetical protein
LLFGFRAITFKHCDERGFFAQRIKQVAALKQSAIEFPVVTFLFELGQHLSRFICFAERQLVCGFDRRAPFAEDSLDSRRMRVTVFPQTS